MGKETGVEWTDSTWPIVQGCDPVSQACVNCYAVPLLWRLAHNPNPKISGPLQGLVEKHVNRAGETILRFTGKLALREDRLTWPLEWKEPRRIFVPSHGDIFHKDVPDAFLDKIFAVMALCPQHTFQVLTKRSKRMREYFAGAANQRSAQASALIEPIQMLAEAHPRVQAAAVVDWAVWPLPNVWLGVSCEDQANADERVPDLLATPAAKRFISAEPLLGPIDLRPYLWASNRLQNPTPFPMMKGPRPGESIVPAEQLHWVIIGGESGPGARDHDIDCDRSIIAQCRDAGVAVFEKQLGRRPCDSSLVKEGDAPAIGLRDPKGGDMAEWPADLRVREMPA